MQVQIGIPYQTDVAAGRGTQPMDGFNWLGLVALVMVAILVFPAARRVGRGRWLPYTAAWLAIIVALVFVHQTFGPF